MIKKLLIGLLLLIITSSVLAAILLNRIGINPMLWFSMPEQSEFSDKKNSNHISIRLEKVLGGFQQITDFQFLPGSSHRAFVLQKSGELFLIDLQAEAESKKQLLLQLDVLTQSEQGLLGIAIHPRFPDIPCIYLNTVVSKEDKDLSRVSEWCQSSSGKTQSWFQNKILMELEQPYKNHNAGHLIFDHNERLYIPWGDGGSREDPHGHAQNLQSWLGKILRVNPEAQNPDIPYSIPEDNPFVGTEDVPDEIYAYGLRNPWKLAFTPDGRLIAADVGQDDWEEVTFIEAGKDHGWNNIEALHCFKAGCNAEKSVLPFIEYGHDLGRSVTGGYVYLAKEIPELHNKYIYGDFVSGQIWAADIPATLTFNAEINQSESAKSYTRIYQLGQWPTLISTFARDANGFIYLADFARGQIYKIRPSNTTK